MDKSSQSQSQFRLEALITDHSFSLKQKQMRFYFSYKTQLIRKYRMAFSAEHDRKRCFNNLKALFVVTATNIGGLQLQMETTFIIMRIGYNKQNSEKRQGERYAILNTASVFPPECLSFRVPAYPS